MYKNDWNAHCNDINKLIVACITVANVYGVFVEL